MLMADNQEAGWNVPEKVSHNWERMKKNVTDHIKELNWGYQKQLETQKITYFNNLASFVDSHTILVFLFDNT
jgi:pyruvate/2-oxoglutarate dehydrogenase complex dihydrolipoamide dehydrogenase (E3) component